jgi:hypothetical protein
MVLSEKRMIDALDYSNVKRYTMDTAKEFWGVI